MSFSFELWEDAGDVTQAAASACTSWPDRERQFSSFGCSSSSNTSSSSSSQFRHRSHSHRPGSQLPMHACHMHVHSRPVSTNQHNPNDHSCRSSHGRRRHRSNKNQQHTDAFASIGIASLNSRKSDSPAKQQRRGWDPLAALPNSDQVIDNAKHLLSGGLSAVVARTCVAPFERVKLEMVLHQRQSEGTFRVAWSVLRQEGVRGMWKGNLLNLLRTAPHKVSSCVNHWPLV